MIHSVTDFAPSYSFRISLGRSFGHPVRGTGEARNHRDCEAYWDRRNVEAVFLNTTRTGPTARVNNEVFRVIK